MKVKVLSLLSSRVPSLMRFLRYLSSTEIGYFSCAFCMHSLVFPASIYSFYSILTQIKCFSHRTLKFGIITRLHKRPREPKVKKHQKSLLQNKHFSRYNRLRHFFLVFKPLHNDTTPQIQESWVSKIIFKTSKLL